MKVSIFNLIQVLILVQKVTVLQNYILRQRLHFYTKMLLLHFYSRTEGCSYMKFTISGRKAIIFCSK